MKQPAYRRMQLDERRAQLLALGADLFARYSYDELSMARIAREAGISKALLYHYFPSKRDYFVGAFQAAAEEVARRTEPDPRCRRSRRSSSASTAYLGWVEENASAYRRLIESAGSADDARSLVQEMRDPHVRADPRGPGRRVRAAAEGAHRRPGVALVHGRRDPRLARAPRHGGGRAWRPARGLPGGGARGGRCAASGDRLTPASGAHVKKPRRFGAESSATAPPRKRDRGIEPTVETCPAAPRSRSCWRSSWSSRRPPTRRPPRSIVPASASPTNFSVKMDGRAPATVSHRSSH